MFCNSFVNPEASQLGSTVLQRPTEKRKKVVMVIPVYNEDKRIESVVEHMITLLQERTNYDFKIVIAEEGSKDCTYLMAKLLERRHPERVKVLHRDNRIGRGYSVKEAWLSEEADIYCYADADLPFGYKDVLNVIKAIEEGKCDVATGSRYLRSSSTIRPALRLFVSFIYNKLVQFITNSKLRDHQCGLKAVNPMIVNAVVKLSKEKHWSWDSEILVLSQLSGFKVQEIPITWIERRHKRTPLKRTIKDITEHSRWLFSFPIKTRSTISKSRGF
jgi:glycosyltransferase involved in cell wall biosynthesis